MWIEPNDHIGRHLFLTGQFDRVIVDVARSFCQGGEQILDIGANIGYVSCALLHLLRECRVVSVEPIPTTYAILSDNLSAAGKGRGRAINAAVSGVSGSGTMAISLKNSGANHLVPGNEEEHTERERTVQVPLITGKELFARSGLDRVDLVKIDVEGHEAIVLESLVEVLESQQPRAIIFEHLGDLQDPAAPIRKLLDPLGYRIRGLRKSLNSWKLYDLIDLRQNRLRAHDYVAVPTRK